MNGSLVPANTKKSILVFGMFRPLPDLLILGIGVAMTVLLLLIFGNSSTGILIVACIPMLIGLVLVLPIPNYHNTLCVIQSILEFYNGRKKFIWRGWCIRDEFKDK